MWFQFMWSAGRRGQNALSLTGLILRITIFPFASPALRLASGMGLIANLGVLSECSCSTDVDAHVLSSLNALHACGVSFRLQKVACHDNQSMTFLADYYIWTLTIFCSCDRLRKSLHCAIPSESLNENRRTLRTATWLGGVRPHIPFSTPLGIQESA
jgi:hypothetical protein